MQADTAFSSKAHDIKIKQISLFIKLSFCSTLKGRRKNKAFTEVEDSATIAHEPYNKYNLETISCPSQTGPQNELRREERGEDCTQFLWDMPSTQTHWIWKLINCFGRTSSSGVRSIFKDASWSWQLGQMRHSSFSRSLQSHRKPQLIPRWKLTQLHQVRDCLLSLSAVRPSCIFSWELRRLAVVPELKTFVSAVPRYTAHAMQGFLHPTADECRGQLFSVMYLLCGHNCVTEWNLDSSFQTPSH